MPTNTYRTRSALAALALLLGSVLFACGDGVGPVDDLVGSWRRVSTSGGVETANIWTFSSTGRLRMVTQTPGQPDIVHTSSFSVEDDVLKIASYRLGDGSTSPAECALTVDRATLQLICQTGVISGSLTFQRIGPSDN